MFSININLAKYIPSICHNPHTTRSWKWNVL